MYIPIYRKWWFWLLALIAIVPLMWWGWRGVIWQMQQSKYDSSDKAAIGFMIEQEKIRSDWESAQKADTYGGNTPEETLRMFIEALEKRDYVLASGYYVVEDRESVYSDLKNDSMQNPFQMLISAYKNGKIISSGNEESIVREVKVYAQGDKIPFGFRFVHNEFTNIWKLTEK